MLPAAEWEAQTAQDGNLPLHWHKEHLSAANFPAGIEITHPSFTATSCGFLHRKRTSTATALQTDMSLSDARLVSVPNPRRFTLPAEAQLPAGIGRSGFFGVAYRHDRATCPWLARYNGRAVGSYKTAYEAALARWICSQYDRDVVEREELWHGSAYKTQNGALDITRFTDRTEAGVIAQIDQYLGIDRGVLAPSAAVAAAAVAAPTAPASQPPANPRRGVLPTELPKTSSRGQYHGVITDGRRYTARWKTLHIGSYGSAFEAGLAWYIAEHYDRDIERDGEHGYKARAYKRVEGGAAGHIERFRAGTEAEVVRLVDTYHGITRPDEQEQQEQHPLPSLLSLEDTIRQFWDDLWLRFGVRDGLSECEELYHGWHGFLARQQLSHLVQLKCKPWQTAVERYLQLTLVKVLWQENEQAVALPIDCRVPRSNRKVWRQQWKMNMTATCSPAVCVAAWERRRGECARQSVYRRQDVLQEEMGGRALLTKRFPLWEDDWSPPPVLSQDEMEQTARQEVSKLNIESLEHMARKEPDNGTVKRELRSRKKKMQLSEECYNQVK
jgi:hypothetical protein